MVIDKVERITKSIVEPVCREMKKVEEDRDNRLISESIEGGRVINMIMSVIVV